MRLWMGFAPRRPRVPVAWVTNVTHAGASPDERCDEDAIQAERVARADRPGSGCGGPGRRPCTRARRTRHPSEQEHPARGVSRASVDGPAPDSCVAALGTSLCRYRPRGAFHECSAVQIVRAGPEGLAHADLVEVAEEVRRVVVDAVGAGALELLEAVPAREHSDAEGPRPAGSE